MTQLLQNIPLLTPFKKDIGILSIYTVKHHPINFTETGSVLADSMSQHTSSASVTSSINTNDPVPLHAHAITLPPSFTDDELSRPSLCFFPLPIILVQVDLNFIRPKNGISILEA